MSFAMFLQILGAVSGIATVLGHALPKSKVGDVLLSIGTSAPALVDALKGKK